MRKAIRYIVGLFGCMLMLLNADGAFSQGINITAKLDTQSISLGDQIKYKLIAELGGGNAITFPTYKDSIIDKVLIVSDSGIDTVRNKETGAVSLQQSFVITSFDTGYFVIPPARFLINNDTANIYETEALLLYVQGIEVNVAEDIKEIKPPLEIPLTWQEIIFYVAIGLGIILVLALIAYFYTNRKKNIVTEIFRTKALPPHQIAVARLEELRNKKLWQSNLIKEYHSELSEIMRGYIEERFSFNALELTTDEIMERIKLLDLGKELHVKLERMLQLSDLAKFAKHEPLPDENELSLKHAFEWVRATMQAEVPVSNEEKGNQVAENKNEKGEVTNE